ncbi:Integrase core domain protein [Marinobacterium sp. xm-g-59]|nr:Integrase core domain protein [Marinobacterium sp. xm-g-59]
MSKASQLLGISRQAIYQSEKRQKIRQSEIMPVLEMVKRLRRFMPRLGTRKLYKMIKPQMDAEGIKLGRDGLFDFLRDRQMLVKPRKSYIKTTHSKHWMKKHPNLLKGFEVSKPEQVFVSDITYVESDEGVHYLSLVTDASSRKIMGHELSWDMKAESVVKALHQATRTSSETESVIHHSDRGLQYCSALYQKALRLNGMVPSMTDGYDCYQNALAERVNGILKQEFLIYRCKTFADLKALIAESVEIYNQMRPHLSLGMKTPEEVHKKATT